MIDDLGKYGDVVSGVLWLAEYMASIGFLSAHF